MVFLMKTHSNVIDTAIERDEAARSPIVASWQRSRILHQLNPDESNPPERASAKELHEAQDQLGHFLHLSSAKLDQLFVAVGDVGCSVVLANKEGIAVARRGAKCDDTTFDKWGLWTGAIWSEESEGTNGIGTCIVEKSPLMIHKDQHFHSKNTNLSCTAAPIFDHNARLLAVIDVSSCRADLTTGFSQLILVTVVDAARRIETDNFIKNFSKSRIILAAEPSLLDNHSHIKGPALFAVDQDDLVIGATRYARDIYGLTDADINNSLPLSILQGKTIDFARDYTLAERRTIQQSLAKSGGNISAAARDMEISRATLYRKLSKIRRQSC